MSKASLPTSPPATLACLDRPIWWKGARQAPGQATAITEGCRSPLELNLKNREVANLTWLGLLVLGLAVLSWTNRDVGRALLAVLRALVQRTFLTIGVLIAIWVSASVAILARLDLWRWDNLKTTILWAVTVAPVAIYQFRRAEKGRAFFRQSIIETIAATTFVQFLIDEYSFPLWVELLLVPVLSFVAMLHVVAQTKPAFRSAERLFASLLVIAAVAYFGSAIIQLASNPKGFFRYETLREFLTPVLLTVMFLPVVYGLAVYAAYEAADAVLKVWMPDNALRAYARRRARRGFGLNLHQLWRWSHDVASETPKDERAVRASIQAVKHRAARARVSPPVFLDEGWSPYAAKNYLTGEGLETGDYHPADADWFASSPMIKLGDGLFPDNLAYYVEGDDRVAVSLKLILNVNNPADASASLDRFRAAASALLNAASERPAPVPALACLMSLAAGEFEADGIRIRLRREEFARARGGYSLILTLKPAHRAVISSTQNKTIYA